MIPGLAGHEAQELERLKWSHELRRCQGDFPYTAETYLHIKSTKVMGFPTLKLNRVQRYLHEQVLKQLREEGWVRQIWGKGRQVGSTTYIQALAFWFGAFHDYRDVLSVFQDEDTAKKKGDVYHTFHDALPPPLQPRIKYQSMQRLEYATRRSAFQINHARNMNVGIGQSLHFLHLSEVARYPAPDAIQGSLFPTLSGVRDTEGTQFSTCIMESTAQLGGEWFKTFGDAAIAGESTYRFIWLPWYWDDAYQRQVPKGFKPTPEEQDLLHKYPEFNLSNLVWYRETKREYEKQGNLVQFLQDYPFCWEEAWQLPEGAKRVFPSALLHECRDLIPGEPVWPGEKELEPLLTGPVEVWERPQEGVFYDCGGDFAEGASAEADWTALVMVRRDTLAQVAQFRGKPDLAAPEFYDLVYWFLMHYNRAQFNPDITGGWGHALLQDLTSRGYGNIWRWRQHDDATNRQSNKLGFTYTRRAKAYLVSNARVVLEREHPKIRSTRLLEEMEGFLTIGDQQWAASPVVKWDDVCNAYMLALLSATDDRLPAAGPAIVEPTPAHLTKPWAVQDIDAELCPPAPISTMDSKPWRV